MRKRSPTSVAGGGGQRCDWGAPSGRLLRRKPRQELPGQLQHCMPAWSAGASGTSGDPPGSSSSRGPPPACWPPPHLCWLLRPATRGQWTAGLPVSFAVVSLGCWPS